MHGGCSFASLFLLTTIIISRKSPPLHNHWCYQQYSTIKVAQNNCAVSLPFRPRNYFQVLTMTYSKLSTDHFYRVVNHVMACRQANGHYRSKDGQMTQMIYIFIHLLSVGINYSKAACVRPDSRASRSAAFEAWLADSLGEHPIGQEASFLHTEIHAPAVFVWWDVVS